MKTLLFVFDDEDAATAFHEFIGRRGYLVCYGGFYNAVRI